MSVEKKVNAVYHWIMLPASRPLIVPTDVDKFNQIVEAREDFLRHRLGYKGKGPASKVKGSKGKGHDAHTIENTTNGREGAGMCKIRFLRVLLSFVRSVT